MSNVSVEYLVLRDNVEYSRLTASKDTVIVYTNAIREIDRKSVV